MPVPLAPEDWSERARRHQARVDSWTRGHLERAGAGRRHPVEDFLFRYYPHRVGQLRRWHPGIGVTLLGDAARERLAWPSYTERGAGIGVDVESFLSRRGRRLTSTVALLRATRSRAPQLGCFGMHEWAMVYRQSEGERRHEDWPLRMGQAATDAVVEEQPLRCTHFDAFRFFTPPARPLNVRQPTRPTQVALEQPGCLHASMDLYKYAYQLVPGVSSDLVADGFALARDVREVDMRASPYDFSRLGLAPVAVETSAGRAEYVAYQRSFTDRAQVLRHRLLDVLEPLCAAVSAHP